MDNKEFYGLMSQGFHFDICIYSHIVRKYGGNSQTILQLEPLGRAKKFFKGEAPLPIDSFSRLANSNTDELIPLTQTG